MPESGVFPGFFGSWDLKPDFWESSVFLYGNKSIAKSVSGCNLGLDVTIWGSGLDVRDFGMFFGKWKRMTTNLAIRPFWVVAGGGIDVREKFGKSEFARDNYLFQINIFVILCCSVCRLSGLLWNYQIKQEVISNEHR